MAGRQAPPRFAGSAEVTVRSSFVLRATRLATGESGKLASGAVQGTEAVMNSGKFRRGVGKAAGGGAIAMAALLTGTLLAAQEPAVARAAKSREENLLVHYRAVDRAEIEHLQRWVAAGHEDWCKDARLVAAAELKRIARDFAGDATELNALQPAEAANRAQFEWTPPDGRATYRVTVERFDWLLPAAGSAEALVWVPTTTEIQIHE